MLETNARIIHPGTDLYLWTRYAQVTGSNISPELLQRACGKLRYQHGLAATPTLELPLGLLVATRKSVPEVRLQGDDWELQIKDGGLAEKRFVFKDPHAPDYLSSMFQQLLLMRIRGLGNLWSIDSPRIWQEEHPFFTYDRISVYRRYEITALPFDEVGVGVAVNISMAFYSAETLAYIFDSHVSRTEKEFRQRWFDRLTCRQKDKKGTMLYDNGRTRSKCYFESAPAGVTCATTGSFRLGGRTYGSLCEYYRDKYPHLDIAEEAQAVLVSFRHTKQPRWVAAQQVHIRVSNNALPGRLRNIDKIAPAERRKLAERFWLRLGDQPFGKRLPGLSPGFWRPPAERVFTLPVPELVFKNGHRLEPPKTESRASYHEHFGLRARYFDDLGCSSVPLVMADILYVAYPESLSQGAGRQFAAHLCDGIRKLTGRTMQAREIAYRTVNDGIEQLNKEAETGVAVFVLNNEVTAYFEVFLHLKNWRVKRVTERALAEHYRYLTVGASKRGHETGPLDGKLGGKRWSDFLWKNAVEVVQLLDAIPYRISGAGVFDSQLVIDVGHDRRHFAISLLVARGSNAHPPFSLRTHVHTKADHQFESLNPQVLRDQITLLVERALPNRSDPLRSILVLRDGRFCGQESEGVLAAMSDLQQKGKLATDARVELVDLRKDTLRALRIWEVSEAREVIDSKSDARDDREAAGSISNPLEGKAVLLGTGSLLLTTTGAATLTQGTAEPLLLVGNGYCSNIIAAGESVFASAQLNWSSPKVAQRLPIPLKRTDEQLRARDAQEIKRLQ